MSSWFGRSTGMYTFSFSHRPLCLSPPPPVPLPSSLSLPLSLSLSLSLSPHLSLFVAARPSTATRIRISASSKPVSNTPGTTASQGTSSSQATQDPTQDQQQIHAISEYVTQDSLVRAERRCAVSWACKIARQKRGKRNKRMCVTGQDTTLIPWCVCVCVFFFFLFFSKT